GTAESTEPAETTPSTSGDSNSGSGSGSGGSGSSGGSSGGGSGYASSSASGSWRQDEGGWWYQYADGSYPANRWVQINSQWYYFGGDGYTCSGWQLINGSWYYLDRTNQNMTTGWHQDPQDGYRYYLDRSNGRMLTGWQLIDDAYYYFNPVEPVEPTWTYDEGSAAWNHTNASYRPFGSLYVSGLTPDGYSVDVEGKWIP
ncbi:MAG: hypothetical protein LUC94_13560, partial [Clostridiales bacterium]|nr:hypothetical protein [Clostridiales bacterium]